MRSNDNPSMDPNYIELLKKRAKESRVYSEHQLVGLSIAEILEDEAHKSLYMRLAKKHSKDFDQHDGLYWECLFFLWKIVFIILMEKDLNYQAII